jgi:hypothetical protein
MPVHWTAGQQSGEFSHAIAGFTPWRMANLGANKWRQCLTCRRWEWV